MASYKYVGNQNGVDYTTELVLETDEEGRRTKSLVLGGEAQELTDEQYDQLKERYILESSDGSEEKSSDGEDEAVQPVPSDAQGPSFGRSAGSGDQDS
jgi:hypothetical protein